MNRSGRDLNHVVRSWLEEGADRIPDRVLDAVEASLPATGQRRAGPLAGTWALLSRRSVRYGLAGAVIAGAVAFGAWSALPHKVGSEPTPHGPPPEANPLPLDGRELAPGPYTLEGFPAGIVFDLPAGFMPCTSNRLEQGICPTAEGNLAPALAFVLVENVVREPCSDLLRDPAPGSVDEFVGAISSLSGFEATSAVDVSIDGFSGKRFVVTAPSSLGCQRRTWSTAQRINGVGVGEVNELTILEIDGAFVMVSLAHFPTDPPRQSLMALREVVDSIRIWR
jgi:hypothetical protein